MTTKNSLPEGKYVQIYLDAIRGNTKKQKLTKIIEALDKFKALKIKGIIWHTASYEAATSMTPDRFKELSLLCTQRGLLSIAAWGLRDGHPEGDGAHIGLIANLPECLAVVFDMEGTWENEALDKEKAKTIGKAYRAVSPNSLSIDQPWPDPTYHWSMFPWEETAAFIDIRAPQDYYNDWTKKYGLERYKKLIPYFADAWKKLEDRRLKPRNLVRPRIKTIQGYKWNGIFSDLINCLLTTPTIFIWSEPFPDDLFMAGLKVVSALENLHFTGPTALTNYQKSVGLPETNLYDAKTEEKLGVHPPKL